jgi:hypothetical protein
MTPAHPIINRQNDKIATAGECIKMGKIGKFSQSMAERPPLSAGFSRQPGFFANR